MEKDEIDDDVDDVEIDVVQIDGVEKRKKSRGVEPEEPFYGLILAMYLLLFVMYDGGSPEMIEVYKGYGFVWYNIYFITAFVVLLSELMGKLTNGLLCSGFIGLIGFYLSVASIVISLKAIFIHIPSESKIFDQMVPMVWMFILVLLVCMNILFHMIVIYNSFQQTKIQYMRFMAKTRAVITIICAAVFLLTFSFWFTSKRPSSLMLLQFPFLLIIGTSMFYTDHGNERLEFKQLTKLCYIRERTVSLLIASYALLFLSMACAPHMASHVPVGKMQTYEDNIIQMLFFIHSHECYLSLKLDPKHKCTCSKWSFHEAHNQTRVDSHNPVKSTNYSANEMKSK